MTPVFGFSRRHVLDRHRETGGVRLDLDGVGVARQRRVRPHLDDGTVRTDAGKRQRHRDIEIGGKADRRLARIAAKHAHRLGDPLDIDLVGDRCGAPSSPRSASC